MLILEYISTHVIPEWRAVRMSARESITSIVSIFIRPVIVLMVNNVGHSIDPKY